MDRLSPVNCAFVWMYKYNMQIKWRLLQTDTPFWSFEKNSNKFSTLDEQIHGIYIELSTVE